MSGNHGGKRMWPSLTTAALISDVANFTLLASLTFGAVATATVVWMGNVKESHWEQDRQQSRERVAGLDKEAARLSAETEAAKAQIATAQADAARANERAAEANENTRQLEIALEKERKDRIALEARYAARRLTPEQATKLVAALQEIRQSVPVIEVTLLGDMEANVYGTDILRAIEASGIRVALSRVGSMALPQYSLQIRDPGGPDGPLAKAFVWATIQAVVAPQPGPAAVFIGLKPPPV